MLWVESVINRRHGCGRWRKSGAPGVGVRLRDGHAGFSGLQHCGSVWACPVCSAKILAHRSLEIGVGLLAWESAGGRLVMGTLTMRHDRSTTLADEFDGLNAAWKLVTQSNVWRKWRKRLGSPGYVRVVEVNVSWENGWHVHIHFVLLVSDQTELVDAFASWLTASWIRALARVGAPNALARAQEVHVVDGIRAASQLGEYLAKATPYSAAESLGRELTGNWSKTARTDHSTQPAWAIAERFGEEGELDMLTLWHEYERGTKGRRQITWSQGLRDVLGFNEVEKSDQDIADETLDSADLVYLTGDGWRTALAAHWPTSRLLDVVEHGGIEQLRQFLDSEGIEYTDPSTEQTGAARPMTRQERHVFDARRGRGPAGKQSFPKPVNWAEYGPGSLYGGEKNA